MIMNHAEANWNRDHPRPGARAGPHNGEIDLICQTRVSPSQEYS